MNLIKLDAIDSTNDFLKEMSRNQIVENFTVVVAKSQTKGKGQMGSTWNSEAGKNLIMSILVKDILDTIEEIFHLNVAVALSVIQVLEQFNLPKLSIKWPNDIMSDNKKLCGILIENSFKSDNKIESIVGIGLNVNQKTFDNLPKASSIAVVMNTEFDLDLILEKLVFQIKKNCSLILSNQSEQLWNDFHKYLYKINVPMPFEDANNNRFMGIIRGVSNEGMLELMLEDDSIKTYGIKEIMMLY
ncbi:biotin--[acetyl-CoA-carboxylase] ligase [Flavobacterium sp. SUN052]|uniref:biotin--[acetyl-CoA-carboxylase] ligase n=1 Tax=Flavobacterium sp. SUN052 TaxID=3002441 RepID=UPI00237D6C40|nr:biotin--[acetyl-CoA-carboxylase] ligase [Flavobacterium sp. SUN052]MEC4005674.1 biotin--[acetyl-CoA-carboxylase] ligase [Flavobacterium sp. SUN052]